MNKDKDCLKKDYFKLEDILKITLEIASLLQKNGADVRRVEDTMQRICIAYNLKKPEVFSITSIIIITGTDKTGRTITQTKRIYNSSTNLTILEETNALSREICENPKSLSYVMDKINEIKSKSRKNQPKIIIGYIIASGIFAMFYGGNINDAISAILSSIILFIGNIYILKPISNQILYTFSMSTLMGVSAIVLVYLGIGSHVDKIMIGDIMLLIPGMALINSLMDMFCGDFVTGTTRVTNTLLTTLAIAGGYLFSFILAGGLITKDIIIGGIL